MNDTNDMTRLSIGAFARSTMLSRRALRLYDETGLLTPAEVDPMSGYRYYRPDQAHVGRLIGLLRAADLSLDRIRDVLDHRLSDPAATGRILDEHLAAVDRRADSTRTILSYARARLAGGAVADVTSVLEPDRPVVSTMVRTTVEHLDPAIDEALARLLPAAECGGPVGEPFGIFHGAIDEESDGPLEVCIPVRALVRVPDVGDGSHDDVRSHRLSGGRLAVVTVEGRDTDFPAILAAYDRVCSWIDEIGAEHVGPPRELWHVRPGAGEPCRMSVAMPYV